MPHRDLERALRRGNNLTSDITVEQRGAFYDLHLTSDYGRAWFAYLIGKDVQDVVGIPTPMTREELTELLRWTPPDLSVTLIEVGSTE